ncbi:MAG: thioredoxin-disulfide reductase [Ignavibacteriaceae bacterium]|jgi:thioredoxin-disulfide reductase|nr:MAG: thioredoxin-disulfide reductase [Chlorobiota bacterium]KXK06307.1 MAG: NADPH-dependent thioredoxin reductase [Chlorobi bacterium OLB4]MBV6399179.1 Thioredoxin reductase [Ignavibacteria bacterium]MCC6885374.1 thioredoxin-disulfide reductase [Ignavibacteriales bacterium]MCE7953617.1 thioredoxin-disulfide reductase [Chlorobi bacterium CHB7]MDL1887493.1 thioredoxin-disulfide reductase [Ignavibacteria bacterium CHB1]MEB2329967.1 thioredoxin-disulfide reductase [Ignavibacteriaceae bacterium
MNNTVNHHRVIIIGSGPAGFTAALYTARANLAPVLFEGNQPGGQLMITTEVENYPGFEHGIMGPELMEIMRKQVHRFGAKSVYRYINKVELDKHPFTLHSDDGQIYTCDALIISTGASAKLLGLPSESKFMGYGVSACATCDGFFFKNQRVLVIGGGDTAMEEADYLTKHASEVTVIHRREEFRASKIMLERVQKNPKIKIVTNTVLEEVIGKEENGNKSVSGARLKNVKTGDITEMDVEGIFIAIGHEPNTAIFKGQIEMDDVGYIKTRKENTYTNIEGVFACGDAQDSVYRQAITAAGTGCMAAIDAERWLTEKGFTD